MIENTNVNGYITATLFDEFGDAKEKIEGPNLVVAAGLGYIASRIAGNTSTAMSHMGIGTGTTNPVAGNTSLASENARVAVSSTVNANVVTYVATFGPGVGTGNINECGLFNSAAANSGTMLARSTSIVLTKGPNDSLAITWSVTMNAV